MTALYVPPTDEADHKKQNQSLQLIGGVTSTNTTNIATNTSNISANTSAISALQAGPLVSGAVASQADEVAATSTTLATTPGRQKYHPAHPKAWAFVTVSAGTYTLAASSGVSGIAKNSTGNVTVTFSTAFTSANFACIVGANANVRTWTVTSRTTTTAVLVTTDDLAGFELVAFGAQ